jgi:hypothetical protein
MVKKNHISLEGIEYPLEDIKVKVKKSRFGAMTKYNIKKGTKSHVINAAANHLATEDMLHSGKDLPYKV